MTLTKDILVGNATRVKELEVHIKGQWIAGMTFLGASFFVGLGLFFKECFHGFFPVVKAFIFLDGVVWLSNTSDIVDITLVGVDDIL